MKAWKRSPHGSQGRGKRGQHSGNSLLHALKEEVGIGAEGAVGTGTMLPEDAARLPETEMLSRRFFPGTGGSSSSSKGFFPWVSGSAFTSSISSLAQCLDAAGIWTFTCLLVLALALMCVRSINTALGER